MGDVDPSRRADNNNPARIPLRPRRLEQRQELLHQVEHASNIQIQYLYTTRIRRVLESRSPGRARIRNQDIQLPALGLPDLLRQRDDLVRVGYVGGDAHSTAFDPGNGVELCNGLIDALRTLCLACGDDDAGGAGEEESCCGVET